MNIMTKLSQARLCDSRA